MFLFYYYFLFLVHQNTAKNVKNDIRLVCTYRRNSNIVVPILNENFAQNLMVQFIYFFYD